MEIKQLSTQHYEITGIQQLKNRAITKLTIFLNALENTVVTRNGDSASIEYTVSDVPVIAASIEELVEFLKKQASDLTLDAETSQMLEHHKVDTAETESTEKFLREIHSEAETVQGSFSDFCTRCDSFLRITLRPYQYKAAYAMSVGHGGFDFSVPGAGKTIITYAAYADMKARGAVDRILVIGPGSAYNAWFDEYVTCFGQQPKFEDLAQQSVGDCKSYLMSSEKNHLEISFVNVEKVRLMAKELRHFVASGKTLLVIDEAHKIKNPNAAVTEAILEITKSASARIILTGTPMPNGYEDLYALTKAFSPFRDILPYQYNQLKKMSKNDATDKELGHIRETLAPYYSRISKKFLLETKELLPAEYHAVSCQMDQGQADLYTRLDTFVGKMHEDIDEDILMHLKKAALIRKMQISANPSLLRKSLIDSMDELHRDPPDSEGSLSAFDSLVQADGILMKGFTGSSITKTILDYDNGSMATAKNRAAVAIAAKITSRGQKVLVWDIFVQNMAVLGAMLEKKLGMHVEMINGTVPQRERQEAIHRFREGNSMVLLANPATLAESISLHKVCQNAIYVNRNFNAAQFIQSKDRIHRINMPAGTTAHYYFIMNENSVDEYIDEKLYTKESRMLAVLDADDIVLGGAAMEDTSIMSEDDIENGYLR